MNEGDDSTWSESESDSIGYWMTMNIQVSHVDHFIHTKTNQFQSNSSYTQQFF